MNIFLTNYFLIKYNDPLLAIFLILKIYFFLIYFFLRMIKFIISVEVTSVPSISNIIFLII